MPRARATDPVLIELAPKTMAVVTVHGDPNVELPKVLPALYGAVYTLKFGLKKKGLPTFKVGALIGRWPDAHEVPKDQWTGRVGLEIPEGTTEVPRKIPDVPVSVETWEYGTVAQVLHIGPFSEEGPAVQRLHDFIESSGYVISGVHEEEYLTSMEAKVQKTLIRYPIRRR